jgi:hypothetical protein
METQHALKMNIPDGVNSHEKHHIQEYTGQPLL